LCNIIWSQNDFNDFYKKYKNTSGIKFTEEITKINNDGINIKGSSGNAIGDVYTKINHITYVFSDNTNPGLLKELKENLPGKRYQDLMKKNYDGSIIQFKFKESQNSNNEILLIYSKPSSLFITCITGNFNYNEAKSLINSFNSFLNSHNFTIVD
jgi:hypothetical protein